MPTYEYACSACSHQWEEVQRITEGPTEVCPKCSKSAAHRLISGGTNFILKGGGWYSDLYASSGGSAKKPESNGTTSTDSGTKSEAKSDTKADATPASTASTPSAPTSS